MIFAMMIIYIPLFGFVLGFFNVEFDSNKTQLDIAINELYIVSGYKILTNPFK